MVTGDSGGGGERMGRLRELAAPFVVPPATGVAVRDRLKHLTVQDVVVLRQLGDHLGALAGRDLRARCAAGLEHGATGWARRKRTVTAASSSRWAGAITKTSHAQWALARRGQLAHPRSLEAGIAMLEYRLAQPLGARGAKGRPGGYGSRREWFAKSRRLQILKSRLEQARSPAWNRPALSGGRGRWPWYAAARSCSTPATT